MTRRPRHEYYTDPRWKKAEKIVSRRNEAKRAAVELIGTALMIAAVIWVLCTWWVEYAHADERTAVYCTCTKLNCRKEPSKHSEILGYLELGEEADATGKTVPGWVQLYGSEYGTMWVSADHLTERPGSHKYQNTSGGRVFIRKCKNGTKVDIVKANAVITVTAELDGWGRIGDGRWVDLQYFEEVE